MLNIVSPNQHIDKDILEDTKLIKIAKKYQTPLYIYDKNIIIKYLNIVKKIDCQLFYSIKANPNDKIIELFYKENSYFEAVSIGELKKVLNYSEDLSKTIFVGPAKSKSDLKFAVDNNIYLIIVESITELKRIELIAKKLNKTINILLRVNPYFNSGGVINMSGATQFGLEKNEVIKIIQKNYHNITIQGLHFYLGTNILDAKQIIDNINNIIAIAKDIREYKDFEIIDIGAGFGIPYYKQDNELDIDYLIKNINKIIANNKEIKFILELGRFLVAKSGIFVAKVIDVKINFDKKFILLDGGTNFFGLNSKFGGFRVSPIKVLNNQKEQEIVTIVGNLCTSSDIFANNILINKIEIGDYIAFYQAGAYSFSASPLFFLSHSLPKEVLI